MIPYICEEQIHDKTSHDILRQTLCSQLLFFASGNQILFCNLSIKVPEANV